MSQHAGKRTTSVRRTQMIARMASVVYIYIYIYTRKYAAGDRKIACHKQHVIGLLSAALWQTFL